MNRVDRTEALKRAEALVGKFAYMLPDTEQARGLIAELIGIAIEKAAEDGRQYGLMQAGATIAATKQVRSA